MTLLFVFVQINRLLFWDFLNPDKNNKLNAGLHFDNFLLIFSKCRSPYFSIFVGLFIIFSYIFNKSFIACLRSDSLYILWQKHEDYRYLAYIFFYTLHVSDHVWWSSIYPLLVTIPWCFESGMEVTISYTNKTNFAQT